MPAPATTYTFCGATVTDLWSQVGWNDQSGKTTVGLVEDPAASQRFLAPAAGQRLDLQVGNFRSQGIVTGWKQTSDAQDGRRFAVDLADPRQVLENAQVILGGYAGTVAVPNCLNPFGYHEAMGFGVAGVNDAGYPFEAQANSPGLRSALQVLTQGDGPYGGPLRLAGTAYSLDLGGLPSLPPFYRVGGGTSRNVLEILAEIADDAGLNIHFVLDGTTIRLRCVSRVRQGPTGSVAAMLAGLPDVVSSSYGIELNNQSYSGGVIFGGDVYNLFEVPYDQSGAIRNFWGEDADGNAIVGTGDPTVNETFVLNAAPIADLLGDLEYPCSVAELRAASVNPETLTLYLGKTDPEKLEQLGLVAAIDDGDLVEKLPPDLWLQHDLVADAKESADKFGGMNADDYWSNRCRRIHEFVRGAYNDRLGRTFLVKVPFALSWKVEPETTQLVSSMEVSTEGGYAPAAFPLDTPWEELDELCNPDGRVNHFATFVRDPLMDVSKLDPDSTIVSDTHVYVRATADPKVYYPDGDLSHPYVAVTLDCPVVGVEPTPLGDLQEIADLLGADEDLVDRMAGVRNESFPIRIGPRPYLPSAVAIALRDNRATYGPWSTAGSVPGRVFVERDESLTPFGLGGYATMDAVAEARLRDLACAQQGVEVAEAVLAGIPDANIGDEIVAGGPNVTEISIKFGAEGLATTLTAQSYTPKPGAFARQYADRLRRAAQAQQQAIQNQRAVQRRLRNKERAARAAITGDPSFLPYPVQQATPHMAIVATMMDSGGEVGQRTTASLQTAREMVANVRTDDADLYKNTAGMSLEGLVRPFSTAWTADDAGKLSHFEKSPTALYKDANAPCTQALDPIRRSDIDLLVTGKDGYEPWTPAQPDPNAGDGFGGINRVDAPVDDGTGDDGSGDGDTGDGTGGEAGGDSTGGDGDGGGDQTAPALHRLKGKLDYENARAVGLRGPVVITGYGATTWGKPVPNADDMSLPQSQWSNQFIDDVRKHPEQWKTGVLLTLWDEFLKSWVHPGFRRGYLKGTLATDGSAPASMEVYMGAKTTGDYLSVSCELGGAAIASGTLVYAAYDQYANKWLVFAAPCPKS